MKLRDFLFAILGILLAILFYFLNGNVGNNPSQNKANPTFKVGSGIIQVVPDNSFGATSVKITALVGNDSIIASTNEFAVNGQEAFTINVPNESEIVTIRQEYNDGTTHSARIGTADGIIITLDIPMAKPNNLNLNLCNCAIQSSTALTSECPGVSYFDWVGTGVLDIRKITITPTVGLPSIYYMSKDAAGVVNVYADASLSGATCTTANLCMSLNNTLLNFGTATTAPYFSCRTQQRTTTTGGVSITGERVIFETVGCTVTVAKLGTCDPIN
jgi:hypothetical protein